MYLWPIPWILLISGLTHAHTTAAGDRNLTLSQFTSDKEIPRDLNNKNPKGTRERNENVSRKTLDLFFFSISLLWLDKRN